MDASITSAGQKPQRSAHQGHKGVGKESSRGQATPVPRCPGVGHTDTSESHRALDRQLPQPAPGLHSWFSSTAQTDVPKNLQLLPNVPES